MKRFLIAVFLLLGASLTASRAEAQVNPCLWLYPIKNPDSTYYDTCQTSATVGHQFCRNGYTLRFDWYVISTPTYNFDTAIVYPWTAIDSQFVSIRAGFENLEKFVGPVSLIKRLQYISDTGSKLTHRFSLRFDSLMNVDTALNLLSRIPNMSATFNGMPRITPEDQVEPTDNSSPKSVQRAVAWPQPCSNDIMLQGAGRLEIPEILDMLCRHLSLPTRFEGGTTIHIDLTTVPSGILFLKFPQQVVRIAVEK